MALDNDWAFLQAALPELQGYVLSQDLYWPLNTSRRELRGVQIPQLTIGSLLISQARLAVLEQDSQQRAELAAISRKIEQVRKEWRANWGRKAGREYSSRLNLWNQYIRELQSDPGGQAAFYPTEVRHRVILRLLIPEILEDIPQNEVEQMNQLDEILRGLTQPGPFVWEPEVEKAFPWDGAWFLYVTVQR